MFEAALAIASVVECKDVKAEFVELLEVVYGLGEVAGLAVEVDGRKARLRGSGTPPSAKLRVARCIGGEADGLEGKVYVSGSFGDG